MKEPMDVKHLTELPSSRSFGHPRGVQPTGNSSLFSDEDQLACRRAGLGRLADLDDGLLLQILELLPHTALGRLSAVSRIFYCFSNHEDLWKALVIEGSDGKGFDFNKTWKDTLLAMVIDGYRASDNAPLAVQGVFSDLLYQPWFLGHLVIDSDWLETETIERRSGISLEDFRRDFEFPNKPVVLSGAAANWPAVQKWSDDYLEDVFGDKMVLAGEYQMTFKQYRKYKEETSDEMPLYLFDRKFIDSAPQLADDFHVPEYFPDDLFSVMGEDHRPDYRWLIIGPEKSGSTFHKDPNSTSAWNAVVKGSKKWIMFPPNVSPPGVHASISGADVVTSVSLMEWFVNFYRQSQVCGVPPVEGVVNAGDVIFVPRGWWHAAINLEDTVAVTQNFVSTANLPYVLRFLRSGRQDLVSGCLSEDRTLLHDRFVESLRNHAPTCLKRAEEVEAAHSAKLQKQSKLSGLFDIDVSTPSTVPGTHSKGKPAATDSKVSKSNGVFSFGFVLPATNTDQKDLAA